MVPFSKPIEAVSTICTHFEPAPTLPHSHKCYVDSGHCCHSLYREFSLVEWLSCPHGVEWTLLNRKYGGCDETLMASIR